MDFNVFLEKKPYFLIVDDLTTVRKIITKQLLKLGFTNFIEATNGEDALDKLKTNTVQIVISDWDMPKLNGVELFKRIQDEIDSKPDAFIMVTSRSTKDEVIEALKMGISDYILKPFDENILKTKLTRVVAKIPDEQMDSNF